MINFTWNQKQVEFLVSVAREDQTRVFYSGGQRAGKSVIILWTINEICKRTPGINFLVGRDTFRSLKLDTFRILESDPGILSPNDGVWADGHHKFEYVNGSKIFFEYLKNNEGITRGPTFGGIYIEQVELLSKEEYQAIRSRLTQYNPQAPTGMTKTYLDKYADFIESGQLLSPKNYLFLSANPKACWVKSEFIDKTPAGFKIINTTTYDNIDNLPKDEIEALAAQSEAFKKKYLLGSWEQSDGLVYSEFNDNNIILADDSDDFELKLDFKRLQNYIAIDPAVSISKFACLFAAILPDNRIYIYDEVVENGKEVEQANRITTDAICKKIRQKINHLGIEYIGLIDYAGNAQGASGTSYTDQIMKNGITVKNARKDKKEASLMHIKGLFKNNQILINSRCAWTIKELGLYSWDEKNPGEVQKRDDDCMDCLRYICNDFPIALKNKVQIKFTKDEAIKRYYESFWDKKNEINHIDNNKEAPVWGTDSGLWGI